MNTLIGLLIGLSAAIEVTGATAGHAVAVSERVHNNLAARNVNSYKDLQNYVNDAVALNIIDKNTHAKALHALDSLRNNNWNLMEITISDRKALLELSNELYNSNYDYKKLYDEQYETLDDYEKLAVIDSITGIGGTIPAPAYLDTSFERYQKEVAPLKWYTNKELADIYKLDYDYNNILTDYKKGAEGDVAYGEHTSKALAELGERNNTQDTVSYLDAIRNIKGQSVINGMTNGARSASEVLANKQAIDNKVANSLQTAQNRYASLDTALKTRADAEKNTLKDYISMANMLSNASTTMYGNDVNRKGADTLFNANALAADETLRATRQAANAYMNSAYNLANAQIAPVNNAITQNNEMLKIALKANNGNLGDALRDYINLGYTQATGYKDSIAKWGSVYK